MRENSECRKPSVGRDEFVAVDVDAAAAAAEFVARVVSTAAELGAVVETRCRSVVRWSMISR